MFLTKIVHTQIFVDRSWYNKYIQKTPIRVKAIRKPFFLRTWTFSNHWPRFYRRFSFSFFSISIRDTVGYWYLTFVSGIHTSKEGVNHIYRKEYSCSLLNECCGSGDCCWWCIAIMHRFFASVFHFKNRRLHLLSLFFYISLHTVLLLGVWSLFLSLQTVFIPFGIHPGSRSD